MLYLIYGEEPYFIEYQLKKILNESKEVLMAENLLEEEMAYLDQMSFFGQKTLVVKKPLTEKKNAYFTPEEQKNVRRCNFKDHHLVLIGKVQSTAKFLSWVKEAGTVIPCDRIKEDQGAWFCAKVLKQYGARITKHAAEQFMERTGYYIDADERVNLLQVEIMLRQLSFMGTELTDLEVQMIPEAKVVNQWKLVSELRDEPTSFMMRALRLFERDGGIPVLSILLRAFRIAYKLKLVGIRNVKDIGVSAYQVRDIRWIAERFEETVISEAITVLQDGILKQKSETTSKDCAYVNTLGRLLGVLR